MSLSLWPSRPSHRAADRGDLLPPGRAPRGGRGRDASRGHVPLRLLRARQPAPSRLPREHGCPVYLEGGIALALLLHAEVETVYSDLYRYESYRADVSDYLESPEPCALLGGGLAFPVGQMGFQVGLRYQWGLIDSVKELPVEVRSRNLAIQFGMAF